MLRNIYVWCLLTVLAASLTRCAESPKPLPPNPPIEQEDTTSVDNPDVTEPIDTVITDTIIVQPLPTENYNALLASSARFGTQSIFTESQLANIGGAYSNANDYRGRATSLNFEFIAPAQDTMQRRPFVLMVHEGAFLFGTLDNEKGKAKLLARKGYATATINYRLGFNGASEQNACGGNNMEIVYAVYRAAQDIFSALHHFVDNAAKYQIDPQQIMVAGSSAGAIAVTAAMYMSEEDFEALQPGIVGKLGRLDPQSAQKNYKIRALLSYLGYGIFKSSYISVDNALPTVFFQRVGDNVLPFQRNSLFFCSNYLASEGAKPVSDRLKRMKIPFELNYQQGVGHNLNYSEQQITDRYALFMKRLWADDRRQIVNDNVKTVENEVIK